MTRYIPRRLTYVTAEGTRTLDEDALAGMSLPIFVLCEPGVDRSTLLERLAERLGTRVIGAGAFRRRRSPRGEGPLLIDALDEAAGAAQRRRRSMRRGRWVPAAPYGHTATTGSGSGDVAGLGFCFRFAPPPTGNGGGEDNALPINLDQRTGAAHDADSKMTVSYLVGDPPEQAAIELVDDLRARIANRVQLTTDGHRSYPEAVEGLSERTWIMTMRKSSRCTAQSLV